jgi:hypothetical protein
VESRPSREAIEPIAEHPVRWMHELPPRKMAEVRHRRNQREAVGRAAQANVTPELPSSRPVDNPRRRDDSEEAAPAAGRPRRASCSCSARATAPRPLVRAVGVPRLDVLKARLAAECGVAIGFEPSTYNFTRWATRRRSRLDPMGRRDTVPTVCAPYKSGTVAAFISLISHLPFTRTNVSSELVCTAILFASLSTHRHSK